MSELVSAGEAPAWEELRVGELLGYAGDITTARLRKALAGRSPYNESVVSSDQLIFNFRPTRRLQLEFWGSVVREKRRIVGVLPPVLVEFTNHDPKVDEGIRLDLNDTVMSDDRVSKVAPWAEVVIMPFVAVRFNLQPKPAPTNPAV